MTSKVHVTSHKGGWPVQVTPQTLVDGEWEDGQPIRVELGTEQTFYVHNQQKLLIEELAQEDVSDKPAVVEEDSEAE